LIEKTKRDLTRSLFFHINFHFKLQDYRSIQNIYCGHTYREKHHCGPFFGYTHIVPPCIFQTKFGETSPIPWGFDLLS
tara:strand:- start:2836 stop:3069 length:234 start_codon:yes stop_codon:yes gene_type:complete